MATGPERRPYRMWQDSSYRHALVWLVLYRHVLDMRLQEIVLRSTADRDVVCLEQAVQQIQYRVCETIEADEAVLTGTLSQGTNRHGSDASSPGCRERQADQALVRSRWFMHVRTALARGAATVFVSS